jgi:hypothetical protein
LQFIFLFLCPPFQTDQRVSPACLVKAQSKILPEIDPLVIFSLDRRKGGARGDLQNPLPLNSTCRRPTPPVKARHPAGTLAPAPPHSDSGQKLPRRPGHRHAHRGHPSSASKPPTTSRPVTSPPTSPSPQRSIPRDAPSLDLTCASPRPRRCMPVWAPRPRRACNGVPVHPTLVWPRFARTMARHQAKSTAPPPPSTLELTPDRTGPETDHTLPELPRVPARPSRHRHPRMLPCTQCTVPPQRAAHGDQLHPMMVYPRPSPSPLF